MDYFNVIIHQLKNLTEEGFNTKIKVIDDLGLRKVIVNSKIESVLMHAQSHAIHHFASISYIIYKFGIALSDSDSDSDSGFGFNLTIPNINMQKN
ncbi:hypothetical protein BTO04_00910 [Polaribacter sp. SA4-10]|uniref:hypothetical protein n=1 Tax=Polaribacter sp. SA4-10 TaxID=754397 RepID=UPI000B3C0BF1|nr:hypothetical protein [Polaribacter sp. SA4-10]ARV05337.1 hypothetical protein BTO04_00910 [Polaribacter sp. SA4-10]